MEFVVAHGSAAVTSHEPIAISADQRAAELGSRLDPLLAAGRADEACSVVADAFAARTDAGDLPELVALVSALPDRVLAECPQVLLELARASDAAVRIRLRARLLERAERLALDEPIRVPFTLALDAERIVDLARDVGGDAVVNAVADLEPRLAAVDPESIFVREARARTSYALGRVLAWRGDPLSVAAAEDALSRAAGAARELRRDEWRSQALQTLGYSVHFYRGEEVRAVNRLREAITLLPVGHARRAGTGTFLADVYVRTHLGDLAIPVLADIRLEAASTGDQRSLGYASWVAGILESERGDAAATLEWLSDAERHPGDWFEHLVGVEFLADAALAAERVGELSVADRYLARAVERADAAGHPSIAWLATGVLNARRGDPAVAITTLTNVLVEDWLPQRDAWMIWLYLALSRLRAGDEQGATHDAVRCFSAASTLVGPGRIAETLHDLPDVLVRLEGNAVRRVAPLAAGAGSVAALKVQPASPRVRLFGGLVIELGTTVVTLPPGRSALLLVHVALNRGPVSVDVAIDELWPGVSTELGRRRIRNVLTRLKGLTGDLVVRHGELLTLAPGTEVDIASFEQACDRVTHALPGHRLALAHAAFTLFRGELLPEVAYLPRVIRRRDDLEQRALGLLRIIADAAEQSGDVDESVNAFGRMAELDPYSPVIVARAARLLRDSGRIEEARRWTDRARALDDE